MTDINDLVAKKVFEKLDIDSIAADIAKGIDGKKLGAAVEKAILAEMKEWYWSDLLGDILESDAVRRQLEEALIEGLKNKK